MTTDRFFTLATAGNSVVLDAEIGHLRKLTLNHGGRTVTPLHTAPWTTDAPIDRSLALPPTEQALSGDFLCAPFCANDVVPGVPLHGWTANGPWEVTGSDGTSITARLTRQVMGAEVTKRLAFRPGEPFLYQTHTFSGGSGRVPISHHAMIDTKGTAALSFSPKAVYFTPPRTRPADPAKDFSLLQYPSVGTDISAVPLAAGGTVDLGTYPIATRNEDGIALEEAPGNTLGWTAVVRPAEGSLTLLLKDARVFPNTSLWMSNGGRDAPPWNNRHIGVLGIEDGRSLGTSGHRASIEPNLLTERGYETAFDLAANPTLRYAIGAIALPDGWTRVTGVTAERDTLELRDVAGGTLVVPFAADWLLG